MSILRVLILVLALAAPLAKALECVQCLEYDDTGITAAQKVKVGLIQLSTGTYTAF